MDWILWGVLFLLWVFWVAVSVSVARSWKKRFRVLQARLSDAADRLIQNRRDYGELCSKRSRVRVYDPQGREVKIKGPAEVVPGQDIEVRL